MQQDYYSALAGKITGAARGSPRLRYMIYDAARSKLRRRLDEEVGKLGYPDSRREMSELEAAIEQIETDLAENGSARASADTDTVTAFDDSAVEIIPPARQLPPHWEAQSDFAPEQTPRSGSPIVAPLISLVGAAILGVAAYVAIERITPHIPEASDSILWVPHPFTPFVKGARGNWAGGTSLTSSSRRGRFRHPPLSLAQ